MGIIDPKSTIMEIKLSLEELQNRFEIVQESVELKKD